MGKPSLELPPSPLHFPGAAFMNHIHKKELCSLPFHSFWSISNSVSTINEHEQRDSTEPRALAALWNNLCCPAAHLQGF